MCTFCDMIVFWIQVQLKQQNTKEKILKYVDEVIVAQWLNLRIIDFTFELSIQITLVFPILHLQALCFFCKSCVRSFPILWDKHL